LIYKGVLPNETMVDVKKIIASEIQGDAEFCNEVEIIRDYAFEPPPFSLFFFSIFNLKIN
jgi:hypothetical protein